MPGVHKCGVILCEVEKWWLLNLPLVLVLQLLLLQLPLPLITWSNSFLCYLAPGWHQVTNCLTGVHFSQKAGLVRTVGSFETGWQETLEHKVLLHCVVHISLLSVAYTYISSFSLPSIGDPFLRSPNMQWLWLWKFTDWEDLIMFS